MPRRKGSNTAPPTGPAKVPPGKQQPLPWTRPPPLFLELGPNSRVSSEAIERQRHEMEAWEREQEHERALVNALREINAEAQAARRAASQEMRARKRQTQELERRLDAVRALVETAGDEKARLATIRAALAEFGRMGRKKRAENVEAEPWRAHARAEAIKATKINPTLKNAPLGRMLPNLVAGPDGKVIVTPDGSITTLLRHSGERIEWPDDRTVQRFLKDLRDSGTLPPSRSSRK